MLDVNQMNILSINDVDVCEQRVLIREDFNVPMVDGQISEESRLHAAIAGIKQAKDAGAKVILLSHFGRPNPGAWQAEFSLKKISVRLSELLGYQVTFAQNWLDGLSPVAGEVILCENVRFLAGELANDDALAKKIATLCDIFVMDAFGCAHRAHASTVGIAKFAKISVAGPLFIQELKALNTVLHANPTNQPVVAVIGGSKVSTKIHILNHLIPRVDSIIIGGGMANTFLAIWHQVGKSLYEPQLVATAQALLDQAQQVGCKILIPEDVAVVGTFKSAAKLAAHEQIFDIGPKTIASYTKLLLNAKTILWNGPMGVFEQDAYVNGTQSIAHAIAKSNAFAVAGGGDTIAAISKFNMKQQIDYISTGGGAFLKYIAGDSLPTVKALQQAYAQLKS